MKQAKKKETSAVRQPPVVVPLSLTPAIERHLDAWQDFYLDVDRTFTRKDVAFVRDTADATESIIRGFADLDELPLLHRLEGIRSAIEELVRRSPIEDLDADFMLAWLVAEANLTLSDDFVTVPFEGKVALQQVIRNAIQNGLSRELSIPDFVDLVVDTTSMWAVVHGLERASLEHYRKTLTRGGFHGIAHFRVLAQQELLLSSLAQDISHALKIRWAHPPTTARQYSATEFFPVGGEVVHAKFGTGMVVGRMEGKIEVQFSHGKVTLASAESVPSEGHCAELGAIFTRSLTSSSICRCAAERSLPPSPPRGPAREAPSGVARARPVALRYLRAPERRDVVRQRVSTDVDASPTPAPRANREASTLTRYCWK